MGAGCIVSYATVFIGQSVKCAAAKDLPTDVTIKNVPVTAAFGIGTVVSKFILALRGEVFYRGNLLTRLGNDHKRDLRTVRLHKTIFHAVLFIENLRIGIGNRYYVTISQTSQHDFRLR